ncbi:MAG TPA: hypothetical protein VN696_06620 [Pyrinomonadaceae bacterium]|nr:hypothetical protein [Pyrinomonadaceae bacterium]
MRNRMLIGAGIAAFVVLIAVMVKVGVGTAIAHSSGSGESAIEPVEPMADDNGFSVEVLIDGHPASEYFARGRRYVEALESAEYELRIHNPTGSRVAVALSVDGMNTIDARHTSAWDAHKWVIEPYGTISVRGWQMSSENARRFYFTTERDSYGAKLGQTSNLGVIAAVFFRERKPIVITPVTPGRKEKSVNRGEDRPRNEPVPSSAESSGSAVDRDAAKQRATNPYPPPDDESAATGIGRTINNGVTWITMDLDPRPASEVTIRYEFRAGLVRLGIVPRDYPGPDVLNRREKAEGFEPKYCPQP